MLANAGPPATYHVPSVTVNAIITSSPNSRALPGPGWRPSPYTSCWPTWALCNRTNTCVSIDGGITSSPASQGAAWAWLAAEPLHFMLADAGPHGQPLLPEFSALLDALQGAGHPTARLRLNPPLQAPAGVAGGAGRSVGGPGTGGGAGQGPTTVRFFRELEAKGRLPE